MHRLSWQWWQSLNIFFILIQDIGAGKGKYYAVNFPLRDGIDDESYEQIFKPVSTSLRICHLPPPSLWFR